MALLSNVCQIPGRTNRDDPGDRADRSACSRASSGWAARRRSLRHLEDQRLLGEALIAAWMYTERALPAMVRWHRRSQTRPRRLGYGRRRILAAEGREGGRMKMTTAPADDAAADRRLREAVDGRRRRTAR